MSIEKDQYPTDGGEDVPRRPAHSIALTRSLRYSGPFAFCITFSSKGMIEE